MINGVIDISHYQGPNIDFARVKAAGGIGVIHKGNSRNELSRQHVSAE